MNLEEDEDYWVPDQNGNPYYPYGIHCAFWPYHSEIAFTWMYNGLMYTVYEQNNRSEVFRNNLYVGLYHNGAFL